MTLERVKDIYSEAIQSQPVDLRRVIAEKLLGTTVFTHQMVTEPTPLTVTDLEEVEFVEQKAVPPAPSSFAAPSGSVKKELKKIAEQED